MIARRLAALLALALLVALPAGAQTTQPAVTIRVASDAADDITPLLYAQKTGMFTKAGLDVQLQRINSGAAITAAVIGGSIDIGKSSILPLINAYVHGVRLQIVAPGEMWLTDAPISGLLVKKGSSISSARDLAGKTISVVALANSTGVKAWIDQNGGDSKAVHYLELPSAAALAALNDGRIDVANVSNPVFAQMLASGGVRILGRADDAIGKHFLITAFFGTDDYLAKNADAVAKFVEVLRTAAAYTNVHHAETVAMTAAFWGIKPAVLAGMERATIGLSLDPGDIQPLINVEAKYGIIERPFNARELLAPATRKMPN